MTAVRVCRPHIVAKTSLRGIVRTDSARVTPDGQAMAVARKWRSQEATMAMAHHRLCDPMEQLNEVDLK